MDTGLSTPLRNPRSQSTMLSPQCSQIFHAHTLAISSEKNLELERLNFERVWPCTLDTSLRGLFSIIYFLSHLKLPSCLSRRSWHWYEIANVSHLRHKTKESLKTETKSTNAESKGQNERISIQAKRHVISLSVCLCLSPSVYY